MWACVFRSLTCVWLFEAPRTEAWQVPLSIGFFRQESQSGWLFPSPGIFPTQGSNPCLLHWHGGSLLPSHLRSPLVPQPPNTEARVKQWDQTTPRGCSENSSSTQHIGGRALRPGPGGAGHCTLCLVNVYLVWYVANVLEFQNGTLFGTRVCAIYIIKLRWSHSGWGVTPSPQWVSF